MLSFAPLNLWAQDVLLKVMVQDALSGEAISGVQLSTEGRQYWVTDDNGEALLTIDFSLSGVVRANHEEYEIQEWPLTAFKSIAKRPLIIRLYPKSLLLDEVTVTGLGATKDFGLSESLSEKDLSESFGSSIAQAISRIKGVSMLSTGPNATKPVIHGMHSNRVGIIENGIRHVGQGWGIEQAPEIDFNMAGSVRVLKGAEAVRYGFGSLGGVVEVEAPRLDFGGDPFYGELSSAYETNGRAVSGRLSLGGSFSKNWAWQVRAGLQNSGDKSTAEYLLNNTGSRLYSTVLQVGFHRVKYESDLILSLYDSQEGSMWAWQLGSEDLFNERLEIGRPPIIYPFARKIDYPYSSVTHYSGIWRHKYRMDHLQQLALNLGYQYDIHKDYHNRRNYRSHIPEYSMRLSTSSLGLLWDHYDLWDSHIEAGAEMQYARNDNPEETGVTPLIPNYAEMVLSAFTWQRKEWAKGLETDWGLRLERYYNSAAGYDFAGEYYEGVNLYHLFSTHLGISYSLGESLSMTLGYSLMSRAPHPYERYSLGVDKSMGVFSKGLHDLVPERGHKGLISLGGSLGTLKWSLEGYLHYVKDYIYQASNHTHFTTQAGSFPVFDYRQESVLLGGADAQLDWAILGDYLTYELQSGLVYGKTESGLYVPNLPPFRIRQALASAYSFRLPLRVDVQAEVAHCYTAQQRFFSTEMDLVDFTPPAYNLFSASLSGVFYLPQSHKLTLRVSAENLLNNLYKEYTNRFRYYFHDLGRSIKLHASWSF